MKRYWLFCGVAYYPVGGMWDFAGDFDSCEEAVEHLRKRQRPSGPASPEWFQVFDTVTKRVSVQGGDSCDGSTSSLDKRLTEVEHE